MRGIVAVACALALAGCKSEDKAKPAPAQPDRPPPMTREEQTRNTDACKDYVAKLCACSTAHPDQSELVELCQTDTALPDALGLVMTVAADPDTSKPDVLLAQTKARKLAKACVEGLAKLPTLGCQ